MKSPDKNPLHGRGGRKAGVGSPNAPVWRKFTNSLTRFGKDFMHERNEPNIQKRPSLFL